MVDEDVSSSFVDCAFDIDDDSDDWFLLAEWADETPTVNNSGRLRSGEGGVLFCLSNVLKLNDELSAFDFDNESDDWLLLIEEADASGCQKFGEDAVVFSGEWAFVMDAVNGPEECGGLLLMEDNVWIDEDFSSAVSFVHFAFGFDNESDDSLFLIAEADGEDDNSGCLRFDQDAELFSEESGGLLLKEGGRRPTSFDGGFTYCTFDGGAAIRLAKGFDIIFLKLGLYLPPCVISMEHMSRIYSTHIWKKEKNVLCYLKFHSNGEIYNMYLILIYINIYIFKNMNRTH